jgi:5-methylcytosine-specific restriction protein A
MPTKAPVACSEPGCPRLTCGGPCPDHAQRRLETADRARGSAAARGYDRRWRARRRLFLSCYPICATCSAPASVVDHVVPKAQGGADDESNFQSLCATCHGRKTMRESVAP